MDLFGRPSNVYATINDDTPISVSVSGTVDTKITNTPLDTNITNTSINATLVDTGISGLSQTINAGILAQPRKEVFSMDFYANQKYSDIMLESLSGGCTNTIANGVVHMNTTTAAAISGQYRCLRPLQSRQGVVSCCIFTCRFISVSDAQYTMCGLIDDRDGYAIGMNADSFAIFSRKNGTFTVVNRTGFNVDILGGAGLSQITIDPTKFNTFMIRIQEPWEVQFFIMDPLNGKYYPFHEINKLNTATAFDTDVPHHNFSILAYKNGYAGDADIYCKNFTYCYEGYDIPRPYGIARSVNYLKSYGGIGTNGGGDNLFTISNPSTFNTLNNKHIMRLKSLAYSSNLTSPGGGFYLLLLLNQTLFAPAYATIESGLPCDVSYDSYYTSTWKRLATYPISTSSGVIDFNVDEIYIFPGQTVSVGSYSIYNQTGFITCTLNWNYEL